MNDTGLMQ